MSTHVATHPAADDPHGHAHGHDDHDHHELSFWRKYVFSTDHKVVGIQYAVTGLAFLFFGFCLMMVMRWQLAWPGQQMPVLGGMLKGLDTFLANHPVVDGQNDYWFWLRAVGGLFLGGVLSDVGYNTFGAMHGTIMVFFGVVPVGFAAFGNFVAPLQVGAPDMAFPRLNMASYWVFFISCVVMMASFFVPGSAAKSGWTVYAPLSEITNLAPGHSVWWTGQTIWLLAMVFNITSSLLGSVNTIATIVQLRAPGMTFMRMPIFTWTQLVTAFLLLLAFPPLEAASFMQLMDRVAGTSFFIPTGLMLNQPTAQDWSGGGSPILFQHLFWFLAHPEVYVLILPAIGIVTEVLANNTRKPLYGYKAMVAAMFTLGFLSFVVWAHHMYMTGMGARVASFFQTTTILISVPSVILLTALLISLWGGSIRFTVPMLFAAAFLPMFGIGGLTGIPLAFNATDSFLHDTLYVIAHFHYVVAPGTIFALFAGVYYWFPKATGRQMSVVLGYLHFWGSIVFINGIFFPMFIQGMAGVHRRWYDGGASYAQIIKPVLHWNSFMSTSAFLLGATQIFFIVNFFYSIWWGRRCGRNPWNSTTVEWDTPSPPGHGNFDREIAIYRGPYEYSVPGADKDYTPQTEVPVKPSLAAPGLDTMAPLHHPEASH